MPVVITFDIEGAPPQERNRIQSFLNGLGGRILAVVPIGTHGLDQINLLKIGSIM